MLVRRIAPSRPSKRRVISALKAASSSASSGSICWCGSVSTTEARCAPVAGSSFMGSSASVWPWPNHSQAAWWCGSACVNWLTTMLRPKSCMPAPMPTARRVGEKRLSAATSSRAWCVAPLASVTCAVSVVTLTRATPSPAISVMSPCRAMLSCTASHAARRIRWLDTSQPSSLRAVRPWPMVMAKGDGPFITLASRSGARAAG